VRALLGAQTGGSSMYLFSRTRTAHPAHARNAMAFAVEVAKRVTDTTGLAVEPWMSVMSPGAGAITWATFFEHLEEWESAMGKLQADTAYGDSVEAADHFFTGPVDDLVVSMLTEMPEPDPAAPSLYVTSVRAVAAHGHLAAAIEHGMALAEAATRLGGLATVFGVANTGPYGEVAWFTAAPSIAALEAAEGAVNSSAEFVGLVDSKGHVFQPGASQTRWLRLS